MDIALWIAQGLLAAAFLVAGTGKLTQDYEKLTERMGWVGDFSPGVVRFIGAAEVLGALGLILPGLTGLAPLLTPIAASGLAILQLGAASVHLRRKEYQMVPINLALVAVAVFIAWGRFGDYPL